MARPPIRFTRSDYEQLPEHMEAELIRGDLVMTSQPTDRHEHLGMKLILALGRHLGTGAEGRLRGSRTEISVWEGD